MFVDDFHQLNYYITSFAIFCLDYAVQKKSLVNTTLESVILSQVKVINFSATTTLSYRQCRDLVLHNAYHKLITFLSLQVTGKPQNMASH